MITLIKLEGVMQEIFSEFEWGYKQDVISEQCINEYNTLLTDEKLDHLNEVELSLWSQVASIQLTLKEALINFGKCLSDNRNQLEVRDLKDFYRIRGVPAKCCQTLAISLLPNDLTKSVPGIDNSDCRINTFFVADSIFDPHNHPLHFVSYIVSGGYTQTIFDKDTLIENKTDNAYLSCIPNSQQVCAEHSKIDTKTDTILELGTVILTRSHKESFTKGDIIIFNNSNIHQIDNFIPYTLTINFISNVGDKEIDVFVSHKTPERKVLSKANTRTLIHKEVSLEVLEKCLMILKFDQ